MKALCYIIEALSAWAGWDNVDHPKTVFHEFAKDSLNNIFTPKAGHVQMKGILMNTCILFVALVAQPKLENCWLMEGPNGSQCAPILKQIMSFGGSPSAPAWFLKI